MRNKYSYTSTDDLRRKRDELDAELERRKMDERKAGVIELLNDEDNVITSVAVARTVPEHVGDGFGGTIRLPNVGKTITIEINGGA